MWNAWDDLKGMGKHEAALAWLKIAIAMFKDNGYSKYLPDPLQPATEKAYADCV